MDVDLPRHPAESIEGDRAEHDPVLQCTVLDADGEHVGTVETAWFSTTTGAVEFIGVISGWVSLKVVAVPIEGAEVDLDQRLIRLPYSVDVLKQAPRFAQHGTLNEDERAAVYEHFSGARSGTRGETQ